MYFEQFLSSKNTILAYRLDDCQISLLREVIKQKRINGRELVVYDTDEFTDLYAIPHFMAFVNLAGEVEEDCRDYWAYWEECRESGDVPEELREELDGIRMPLTYVFNCSITGISEGNYLFINRDIFADRERLRLMVLQEIKNVEGKGRLIGDGNPRIDRVLYIYKQLVYHGSFSKSGYDKLCTWLFGEPKSKRMFLRDMQIIQRVDGNVKYNKSTQKYEMIPRR